jgi:hypothetical protein
MSVGRRAYDILRGWVSHEWDRIREIERDLAEEELNRSMDDPYPARPAPQGGAAVPVAPEDAPTHARKLLGVAESASFEEIRKAFDRLNKRSDPARFPAGSSEREQAAEIQKRIHWAYKTLTDSFDTVDKRFRSLELD